MRLGKEDRRWEDIGGGEWEVGAGRRGDGRVTCGDGQSRGLIVRSTSD